MPLNQAARAEIDNLAGEGIKDLTPDEVVMLNDIGGRLMDAGRDSGYVRVRPPVECGGLVLHPLTLAASDYISVATGGRTGRGSFWAIVSALVHAREPDELERLYSRWARLAECARLRHRCSATREELEAAVCAAMTGDEVEQATVARLDAMALCAYIERFNEPLAYAIRTKALEFIEEREVKIPDERFSGWRAWRSFAAELGTMTGVSPDYWYREDHRIALKCYVDAKKAALAKAGVLPKGEASRDVVEAMKAMMDAKEEIRARRRNNGC